MFHETLEKDHRVLRAFTSLLTLVETLAAIPEQEERSACKEAGLPVTIATAGPSLAESTREVLGCAYVAVIALNPPDYRQHLLGVSGLDPDHKERLRVDTEQTPLADYIEASSIDRLRSGQVVTLDLQKQPFLTPRATHGARYRLVAPMVLHGQLIGLFTMAKTDAEYADVHDAYPLEEIALAKGIARLAAQVIERVSLLQAQATALANVRNLQEINRRYEDILSTTSHELRTPLTTIKINIQLALRRCGHLKKQAEQQWLTSESLQRVEHPLENAVQNFAQLDRMIRKILDDPRTQAGMFAMMMQPGNLVDIVRQAVESIRQTALDREILLSLPVEKHVPVFADADGIAEVVINYLSNALKYAPANRPIDVSVTCEGSLARVTVRDHGPGLSPQNQELVWERFYRVPEVEVQDQQSWSDANLGFGLYLCKKIIERHHGKVGVDSTPGQGSSFWFTLALETPA